MRIICMLQTSNEQLIKRYFEEVWNDGRLDVLNEIISPDYINHNPGVANPVPGPEGLKPIVVGIRKAFPDLKYVIENIVVSDTQVAVHTTMHGTHTGDFFGIAPTNKVITVSQMQIERIINNKIIEHWRVTDELTLLKQLGQ
ncbi:MAG: hypothetical protein A3E87_05410 [Gammaproteobacteria bacterium RIFCSPHIGHO2_12_FULL_35_23]|nr:MAG: hypothetical protein A3E87_05410 [Gammaproteobacteria bacterium RIFCSPHIGHO2_12_FULL_35_23]